MTINVLINNGFCSTSPIIKTSSFKRSVPCKAKIVMMQNGKENLYQVLSLDSNDVSINEIKKAYRHKALQFHPDTCIGTSKEESTKRFIEIKLAYETLSDPGSRERYDLELSLMDSKVRSCGNSIRNSTVFSKEIWEIQLQGLKERSQHRLHRRRNQCGRL